MNKLDNIYVFGNAEISVGSGYKTLCKTPFIKIGKIERQPKIGFDLLQHPTDESETIMLQFKNLEGLAVLEKAVKNVKKQLKALERLKP